jgi:hypothetical protein
LSSFINWIAGVARTTFSNVHLQLKCEYIDTPPSRSRKGAKTKKAITKFAPHLISCIRDTTSGSQSDGGDQSIEDLSSAASHLSVSS